MEGSNNSVLRNVSKMGNNENSTKIIKLESKFSNLIVLNFLSIVWHTLMPCRHCSVRGFPAIFKYDVYRKAMATTATFRSQFRTYNKKSIECTAAIWSQRVGFCVCVCVCVRVSLTMCTM